MALITFKDSNGTAWRVWNVSRESLGMGRTNYLGEEFRSGWLVFQREASDERRRLASFPDDWAALEPRQLEELCRRAHPVAATRYGARIADVATLEVPRFEP